MKRTAVARWEGSLKEGHGTVSAPGKALDDTPYSFKSRFENGPGTNPEELIAAAHAGCFSMALSAMLGKAGYTPAQIRTDAQLSLEQTDGGWSITDIMLSVRATVPGIEPHRFQSIAADAKENCPVSRALRVPITMNAELV